MAKRFTDTDKYKKSFIRGLPGPYKLLWDYLYHDCNHAGVWQKDFEIAQIYLGIDMPVNEKTALELFNKGEERIKVLNGGSKWLILPFIDFQYGTLNPENRVHSSVLSVLSKEGFKVLASPLQRAKDKDKDKDKDKETFDIFYKAYPRKEAKQDALKAWLNLSPSDSLLEKIISTILVKKQTEDWIKENGKYVPLPASWIRGKRWEDEIAIDTPKLEDQDTWKTNNAKLREELEAKKKMVSTNQSQNMEQIGSNII